MPNKKNSETSLQVAIDQKVIFQSYGKWLYPLFDLEEFIADNPIQLSRALIHDKVIGKAAALLLIRLGAGRIHGELMSQLARQVLTYNAISHTYDRLVPSIDCQTETLLQDIDDPEIAYQILCQRAQRCKEG